MPADKKQLSKLKFQSQAEMSFAICQVQKKLSLKVICPNQEVWKLKSKSIN